jgi:hypothetical protein
LLDLDAVDYSAWLNADCYGSWPGESGIFQATMSEGNAQVFLSPLLYESLEKGAAVHPVGSAAVRVMYKDDKQSVHGFALSLKVSAMGPDNWFWYERFLESAEPSTAGVEAPACQGCHSHGVDFAQSILPLR